MKISLTKYKKKKRDRMKEKERWGECMRVKKNCFIVILLYIVKFVHKNLIIKISNNNY